MKISTDLPFISNYRNTAHMIASSLKHFQVISIPEVNTFRVAKAFSLQLAMASLEPTETTMQPT